MIPGSGKAEEERWGDLGRTGIRKRGWGRDRKDKRDEGGKEERKAGRKRAGAVGETHGRSTARWVL